MKAVHILGWIYAQQCRVLVDVLRQRQLNQDAVHCWIGVQAVDHAQQLLLRNRLRQMDGIGQNAQSFACAGFIAHINGAGRVIPRHHHDELWRNAARLQIAHALRLRCFHLRGQLLAIQNDCAHSFSFIIRSRPISATPAALSPAYWRCPKYRRSPSLRFWLIAQI